MDHLNPAVLVLVLCSMLVFITEVTSNTAICALFLPILSNLESGLSAWISSQLNALHHLESVSLVLAICFIMAAVTEVTSNAATCALFLPILGDLALTINADPLYIMLPAAIASSFAFMLPVATPPNAVIFSYGYIRVIDMAKCGFVLNIIAVLVLIASTETLGRAIFGFEPLSAELIQNTTLQTIT